MRKQQLFLIGTGRSGTTLIQRVINTFPNTMIWGEHAGFVKQLSELYFYLKDNPSMHEFSYENEISGQNKFDLSSYDDPRIWQAWVNWFRPDDLRLIFKNILDNFFCPDDFEYLSIWGFKEIRYGPDDKVLLFLSEIYPEANFLFISRDSLNNIESQIATFHRGKSKFTKIKRLIQLPLIIKIANKWKRHNAYYLNLARMYPETHHLVRYEDVLNDLAMLNPLLGKYNLEIGEKQLEVLGMKEGTGTSFKKSNSVHLRWKNMGFIPSFISEIIVGSTSLDIGYKRAGSLKLATFISKKVKQLHL